MKHLLISLVFILSTILVYKDVIITQDYIIFMKSPKIVIVPKIKSRPMKPRGGIGNEKVYSISNNYFSYSK